MASKTILLGMSGGVDSSASALLLSEQGYRVIGVTFLLSAEAGDTPVQDAKRVCSALGIEHRAVDFSDLFNKKVVTPFLREYALGRTPNPCVFCNEAIKFGAFFDLMKDLGADGIATGHYARTVTLENGEKRIGTAAYLPKDQSYVLYPILRDRLPFVYLPLGEYTKPDVRILVEKAGLPVAHKPDSQDICFIPDGNCAGYLEREAPHFGIELPPCGPFVNQQGEVLGTHKGIWRYTVGQRKGLGIALGKPAFVKSLEEEGNRVVLCGNSELFSRGLTVSKLNFHAFDRLDAPIRVSAKIRYSQHLAEGILLPCGENRAELLFREPQRAITPGQSAVFYLPGVSDGGSPLHILLGGGIIGGTLPDSEAEKVWEQQES